MRKFKCIGLEETNIKNWAVAFTEGLEYEPVIEHGYYDIPVGIVLMSDRGLSLCVDKGQFEEVKEANDE